MKLHASVSLLALSLSALAPAGLACNGRKANAPPVALVTQLDFTTWDVFIPGYVTQQIGVGVHFCAAGMLLPAGGRITDVVDIAMYDAKTAASMQGFRWQRSTAVKNSWNRVKAGNWVGFLGQVAGPAAGGVDNTIRLRVSVSVGTTLANLTSTLKQALIGTDGATAGGDLTGKGRFQLTLTTVSEKKCDRNEKLFFNAAHTSAAVRPTTTDEDTVYSMQASEFRFGQGNAAGWRGVLQDSNAATAEKCQMGYVKMLANGKPDTSAAGLLTNVEYSLFGTSSGTKAIEWTLTTASKVPVDRRIGVRMVLAAPRSGSDALTLLVQEGTTLKIPTSLRKQYTYVLQGSTAADYRSAGTTVRMGVFYECPVMQIFTRSTAYGPSEVLLGPEALFPDSSRGDQIGFRVESAKHASGFALVFVGATYATIPVKTPFKDVLLSGVAAVGFPFPLNTQGTASTPTVAIPGNVAFAAQAVVFKIGSSSLVDIEFTDAAMVASQ